MKPRQAGSKTKSSPTTAVAPEKPAKRRAVSVGSLEPMLASVGSDIPTGEGWTFEPKFDGIRVLAFATDSAVKLMWWAATFSACSTWSSSEVSRWTRGTDGLALLNTPTTRS